MVHPIRWLLVALVLVAASCVPEERAGEPPLELKDVNGTVRRPLEAGDQKAVVLLFLGTECPISNSYAPEIRRLCSDYVPRKVGFYVVYADADLSEAEARKSAEAYGYPCPALLDPAHVLVHRAGATVTPEAVVILPDGTLAYRGRIDDLWAAIGVRRHEASSHDLRSALDALLERRPVAVARTAAVGCRI